MHKLQPAGPEKNFLFLAFKNDADRQRAIAVLNGYEWKKCVMSAKETSACPDPLQKKRKNKDDVFSMEAKKTRADGTEKPLSVMERVRDATTQYHDLSYEEQVSSL